MLPPLISSVPRCRGSSSLRQPFLALEPFGHANSVVCVQPNDLGPKFICKMKSDSLWVAIVNLMWRNKRLFIIWWSTDMLWLDSAQGQGLERPNGIMFTTTWVRYKARGGCTLYWTDDYGDYFSFHNSSKMKVSKSKSSWTFFMDRAMDNQMVDYWVNPWWSVATVLDCLLIDIWFFICWVELVPFFDIIYWVKLLELSHSLCSWTLKFWACGNYFLG